MSFLAIENREIMSPANGGRAYEVGFVSSSASASPSTTIRPDWTPSYYHRADTLGIGFDRTATGSNAVAQYFPPVRDMFASRASVPEANLLWFHHVGWDDRMRSGRTLWAEMVDRYNSGVDTVKSMRRTWGSLDGRIDAQRFGDVQGFLAIQEREAKWWRDAAIQYFGTFSRRPIPEGYEKPAHTLDYYMKVRCPADPRRPRCDSI